MKAISHFILRIFGWQAELAVPMPAKCVLVGAPHTTNWDFPLAIFGMAAMGIRFNWVGKHTLFRWPFGFIMRALGGIPLDRRSGGARFAIKAFELFDDRDSFILAIAPEGTRHRVEYWKAGFYKIALKCSIPIALGYVDYRKKIVGIGKIFVPSGDSSSDFVILKEFYSDKIGKHPEKQGSVRLKKKSA
jgi:1-acyl-sn-glycerol-3-phosphate acyltransferase